MNFNIRHWLKISLLNLFLVALLGALMRFKIGFEFPYFSQKYLQYAHSHFAFSGWITQSIYVLLINYLFRLLPGFNYKTYRLLLIINLICAYGMLITFTIQGYGLFSILFSTGTIVTACLFAYVFFRDLKGIPNNNPAIAWFKAALWFNIISSIGTVYLAYIMVSHDFHEKWYLAAVYFYLHFQYNGFFIFSCLGLSFHAIVNVLPKFRYNKNIFLLFFTSVIPAYFLSTLWAGLPVWLYVIVIAAALLQVLAWILMLRDIRSALPENTDVPKLGKQLLVFVALAFSVKLFLQLGSTIPALSKLAFGFRPIVIAYLHLVLLAVISVFLIGYFYSKKLLHSNRLAKFSILLFVIGVLLNELVLAVEGVAAFSYTPVKFVNEILFVISLVLLIATLLMWRSQRSLNSDPTSVNENQVPLT